MLMKRDNASKNKVIVLSRRIAIVIDPWDFPFNGTVVSTRRFVMALEGTYDFRLLATPDPEKASDSRMVKFAKVSIPGFNRIINAMKVPLARPNKSLMRQALQDCDVLHVQFPFFLGFSAITEARKCGIPVICSFHVQPENLLLNIGLSSRFLTRVLYKLFVAGFYNRADLVIAPSEFAANILRSHGLKRPVKVLSNGVPEVFLSASHQAGNAGNQTFKLLSVGRLAKEKQHKVILQAVAKSRFRDSIELSIVGAGPLERTLREQVRRLGINVTINSVTDNELLLLYAQADLFVHAGDIELEGMSVVEAMATGNTVLVSDSRDSATATLVNNNNALFIHGDSLSLANKIDYWLSHQEERIHEAKCNRAWARQRTHAVSASQLRGIYDEFLALEVIATKGITQIE